MKKKIRIINTILLIMFLVASAYYLVFATEENLSVNSGETELVSGLSGWTKTYSLKNPGGNSSAIIEAVNNKLKDKSTTGKTAESYISGVNSIVLNAYNNVYCAKHKKGLSSAGSPVIKGPHIFNKNMNDYITFTKDDSEPKLNNIPTIFEDRCEKGEPESGGSTASNFHIKLYWSGDLKSINNYYGIEAADNPSNVIPYAVAFNDKEAGEDYTSTNTQLAMWGVTGNSCNGCNEHSGNGKDTTLYKAGKAIDDYELQVTQHGQKPTITVGKNAGTVLAEGSTDTYRVGPFNMSDYAFAYSENVKNYSGKELSKYKGLIGGIDDMQITVQNDSGTNTYLNIDNNTVKIVYKDWYGNATSKGERNRNTGSYTSAIPSNENIYPAPNSTFYLDIKRSAVPEDSTLKAISVSYRKTETSGKGDVLITRYAKTKFTVEDTGKKGCGTYYCTNRTPGYASHCTHSDGGSKTCTYTWTCDNHDMGCGCAGGHTIDGCVDGYLKVTDPQTGMESLVPRCLGHKISGCNCACDGHSGTHTSVFKCSHGHEHCNISEWKANTPTKGYGQPILVATEAKCEVIATPINNTMSIRMTTDITIKKYIKEVKHDTNTKITFGNGNVGGAMGATQTPSERARKSDSQKEADPVYAEYGDIIKYQIDVINAQKCQVKLKLKDILPSNIELISKGFKDNAWLTIPGNKTTSYEIVLRTIANDNKVYVNEVRLLTKNLSLKKNNTDNVDFIRTTDSYNGPVVNIAEIESTNNIVSKEYFKINDYNISIDKYVSKYNAEMMKSNNNNGFTNESYELENRENKDEVYKSTHPFPVEQSETLIYSIKLTNNSTKGKGNKVATQIRPSGVIDILDTGLEFVSLSARIVKADGSTRLSLKDSTYSVIQKQDNKQELTLTLANKEGENYVILDPGESLVYEMLVKVTESNLYLNNLKNTASISVLTNINNGKNSGNESMICTTCSGNGKITLEKNCTNCGGDGETTTTEICSECLGKGTCSQCNGTGIEIVRCIHEQTQYICTECNWEEVAKPEICNSPLGTGECSSTTFIDICTECNKESSECSHYKYKCISCEADYDNKVISCSNEIECGETRFDTKCTICDGDGSCNHIIYICNTCEYSSKTEFTECPKVSVDSNIGSKICGSTSISKKCSKCGQEPDKCYCYEHTCKKCGIAIHGTKTSPTKCKNMPKCRETTFNVICIKCNSDKSKCTHFEKKCAECGNDIPSGATKCVAIIEKHCKSTSFEKHCLQCLGNSELDATYSIVCTKCNGTKTALGEDINCQHCNNTGKTTLHETCDKCIGKGTIIDESKCASCNGTGETNSITSGDRIVRTANGKINRNINTKETSSEYVKMKDLVISGKVWLDRNKDGTMGYNSDNALERGANSIDVESNPSTYISDTTGKEYAMKGIAVKLYTSDGTLVRITETDENGLFTFARKEDLTNNENDYYAGLYSRNDNEVNESEQRIEKATNKDANKNYTINSNLISYYVEYEYDGLVYKSTEIYAGSTNLNEDDTMKAGEAYKYDSNAYEFTNVRDEFDKKYEIIAFDKGYAVGYDEEGNIELTEDTLAYEKNGHNSYIKENDARKMTARSFINVDKQTTNYLWLHKQTTYDKPETEYLKYINLGLEEREDVDISITHDVYEVKTTVNGEEMIYEYNQNNETLDGRTDGTSIDKKQEETEDGKESERSLQYDSPLYMTGYMNDKSSLRPYEFRLYNSDHNYKVSQYNIDTVKEYKGTESELNVETTFRIKVTNNSITNDEPYLGDGKKDIKVYTGINEIAQYYDNQFVDLEFNEDGTVKTFNIKTKDENGYLINTPLQVVKAEYVMKDGARKEAVLSKTSEYNKDNEGKRELKDAEGMPLYSTLYIRPKVEEGKLPLAGDIILAEGESVDILITFVVDKEDRDNNGELYVHIDGMVNVAEISAYSTYYKNEDGTYYAAGLVDKDSNPGNFGELYGLSADKNVDSQEYLALYEDDTFKTGIEILLQNPEKERMLTGFVWDDARTEVASDHNGTQYIGDGKYDPTLNAAEKQPNAKRNQSVSNKEEKDIAIQDMKTQLVEMIKIPIWEGEGDSRKLIEERVYEETIVALDGVSQMVTKTDIDGMYQLKGYIPGEYIVKFFYGHDTSTNMLIFNGQDYKSTTYQAEDNRNLLENYNTYTAGNKVGNSFGFYNYYMNNNSNGYYDYYHYYGGNNSNGYYDYYDNNNSNGYYDYYDNNNSNGYYDYYHYYGNNNSNGYYDYYHYYGNNNSDGYYDYYVNTDGNADGNTGKNNLYAEYQENSDMVLAKLEQPNISDAKDDEIRRLEVISYSETMNNNLNNILRGKNTSNEDALVANTNMVSETTAFLIKTEKELANKKILTYKETMEKFDKTKERHPIKNIDFGIEYRPELQVSLNKYISNITITTSDENSENTAIPLVDAKFNEYYGIVIKTDIDSGATEFLSDAAGNIVKVGRYATNQEVEKAAREANVAIPENIQRDSNGAYIITLAGTELDTKNSVGLSNLQYVENMYDRDAEGKLFLYDEDGYIKTTQGFVYLNIDDEIMQGATISVKYIFAGNNLSEIDRVSSSLSELRFKENDVALKYRGDEGNYYNQVDIQQGKKTGYIDLDYSGAMTARNRLFSEYYAYELEDGQVKTYIDKYDANKVKDIAYRIKTKTIDVDDSKKLRVVTEENTEIERYSGYFGRYLGSLYYTGRIGEKDIVAELKIDKILDYIDNDLVFDNSKNNGLNNLWKTTTSAELLSSALVNVKSFGDGNVDADQALVNGTLELKDRLLDSKERAYDTPERSNLAILLDDRIKDYDNPEEDTTVNKDISKYLSPRYSDGANSFGTVSLIASKVISAEETTEDMNYENIGEIIQYSSVTGRVTPLSTTLGNVKFVEGSTEWDESRKESDTAATEQITLTPPTGLGKVQQIVRNTVEGASYMVIVIIAVSVVVVAVLVGIKLYRKRRIK